VDRLVTPARIGALLVAAALVVGACGGGGGNPTPTRTTGGSPSGSLSPTTTPTGRPTASSSTPWPAGWGTATCALFADTVVMQELAVDVGRALDEDERDDAQALNVELAQTASSVREQLSDLPPWEAAAPFERQMASLVDLADQMAQRYERHFDTGRRNPLDAARQAGAEMREVVPRVLDRLDTLARAGLSCPGVAFELEVPPAP
jgi:hypothetical protein